MGLMSASVLICGAVSDGLSDAPAGRGEIAVRDGVIIEIGRLVNRPEGAELIDLSERMVGPGFIDTHVGFARNNSVEQAWRIVQPLLDDPPPVSEYPAGWHPVQPNHQDATPLHAGTASAHTSPAQAPGPPGRTPTSAVRNSATLRTRQASNNGLPARKDKD